MKLFIFLLAAFLLFLGATIWIIQIDNSHLENSTILTCFKQESLDGFCIVIETNSSQTIIDSDVTPLKKIKEVKVDEKEDKSLNKQCRLTLVTENREIPLSTYGSSSTCKSQKDKIDSFLSNQNKSSLNVRLERAYRLRFYLAIISATATAIVVGVITSIIYIRKIKFNHSVERNELERTNNGLVEEAKGLRGRKNQALGVIRNLEVILKHYEDKKGKVEINVGGNVEASTFNFGEMYDKVINIREHLESDISPDLQSSNRSKKKR